jgi:hypothetical protein
MRRSARYSSADPKSISFPDNQLDFPMNYGTDKAVPPDPSKTAIHSIPALRQLFQIPSKLFECAMNLNISPDHDSEDDYEEEFNLPLVVGPPESTTGE